LRIYQLSHPPKISSQAFVIWYTVKLISKWAGSLFVIHLILHTMSLDTLSLILYSLRFCVPIQALVSRIACQLSQSGQLTTFFEPAQIWALFFRHLALHAFRALYFSGYLYYNRYNLYVCI
jgi:hypothetical protein